MRALAYVVAALIAASVISAPADETCGDPRLLVLSAFPGELDPLLAEATVGDTVTADGFTFYAGELRGHQVALGLTGIGTVNAEAAARAALDALDCGVAGVVFSGVSGGQVSIGDVVVADAWTLDEATWFDTDPAMLATASEVADDVELTKTVPAGDPACIGIDPTLVPVVTLEHEPSVTIGGAGRSSDPFGGRAFPCFPGGGDVFGCHPCRAPLVAPDAEGFVERAVPFIDPAFFFGYFEQPPSVGTYDVADMETAAVAQVATEHGIPFIAFRALSDGNGDPLMLPGFPFQFFVYRQLAAENAARMALAFLEAWAEV